jgi:hypothetical protein
MIRRHDFNSEWWGEDVGIVSDSKFFEEPSRDQSAALRRFAWVEFVQPVSQLPSRRALAAAGFFYADTQVRFRLDLRRTTPSQCSDHLAVESAADSPFHISPADIRPFLHERFGVLPGITESRLSARYSLWASRLIASAPVTSLRFTLPGATQGWFLAQLDQEGLELTLAMMSAGAQISGFDLYARAIAHFADCGHRLGYASFSVRNSSVLNIYSRLAARFLEPREIWMWLGEGQHRIP